MKNKPSDIEKNRFTHMTGEEKLQLSIDLYWSARELKKAALREQYPELTDEELEKKLIKIFMYART